MPFCSLGMAAAADQKSAMKEFIQALSDNDEKWKSMLVVDGFLTANNFRQWSKEFHRQRACTPIVGVPLWRVLNAVIDLIGTDPMLWNPPRTSPSNTFMWMGLTRFIDGFQVLFGVDAMARHLLEDRLADECFDINELIRFYFGHTTGDLKMRDSWEDFVRETGVKITDKRQTIGWRFFQELIDDCERLTNMLTNIGFNLISSLTAEHIFDQISSEVLHANAPESIAARIMRRHPGACITALRTRPDLLEDRKFAVDYHPLREFVDNAEDTVEVQRVIAFVDRDSLTEFFICLEEIVEDLTVRAETNIAAIREFSSSRVKRA